MSNLVQFLSSFIQDSNLLQIAGSIPSNVQGVKIDADAKGLEIILGTESGIPTGEILVEFEEQLRDALSLGHVRFYFAMSHLPESEKVEYTIKLLPWILYGLKKENPMYCSILVMSHFRAENNRILICRNQCLDEKLEEEFQKSFQHFVSKYLSFSLDIQWNDEKDAASPEDILEAFLLERKKETSKTIEAQPEEKQFDQEDAAPNMSKKNKTISGEKSDTPVSEPSPDSWVSKAKAQQLEASSNGEKKKFFRQARPDGVLWGRWASDLPELPISEFTPETGQVHFEGHVEFTEARLAASGRTVIVKFYVTDQSAAISCVSMMKPEDADWFEKKFKKKIKEHQLSYKKGEYARFQANVEYDGRFARDLQARVEGIMEKEGPEKREDAAAIKRVELHCHSKMSDKDAVSDVSRIFEEAYRMGHPACALTDHGVVQGFPEAAEVCASLSKKDPDKPFKMIYGLEGYLIDDGPCVAYGDREDDCFDNGFVAIDIETTGLNCLSDGVIEIGAALFEPDEQGNFVVTDTFSTFVQPEKAISQKTVQLTGITEMDIQGAPSELDSVKLLSQFIGERPVCGHNVFFDLNFLRNVGFSVDVEKHEDYRVKFLQTAVDTLELARIFYPELPDKKLGTVAAHLQIEQTSAHRALDDASVCGKIFASFLKEKEIRTPKQLNELAGKDDMTKIMDSKRRPNHIIFLAQNQLGLYHLYQLVTASHLTYFRRRPRIPKSLLTYFRSGLIIGSACERGDLFQAVLNLYQQNGNQFDLTFEAMKRDKNLLRIARYYDYLEIQPITNNMFYLRNDDSGLKTIDDLQNLNKLIVRLGDHLRMKTIAATDSHFIDKEDGEYRKYMLIDMGFKDAQEQADLYFRTTDEMLKEFSYLGEDKCFEVVVTNTNKIADEIKPGLKPFPHGTFPPIIDTAADDIRALTWESAEKLYAYKGEVDDFVKARVEKELDSIIGNGFAIMYYIAYRLVKKSNEDGYIVGSRGSVGSSLVATLCGISEVNPLPPHYRCSSCNYTEFVHDGQYGSGYDLPPKNCPDCEAKMICDGQDIPFETFLGFYGDKQPDIDLNFSGEYQARAHKYVEELFGKSHTFRAGTISGYAEKNANAVVNKIQEATGEVVTRAELRRRALGLIGVKRTTGQHPGGIVVVPKEMDVFEFTPVQRPANKASSETVTTHFDFNAMHDTILKLDILGHFDPTMLRMLGDLTGIDVRTIPIPDEKVMSLFMSTEALGIPDGTSEAGSATLGLSEMGTFMARDMIAEAKPRQFYDLVQLMGLSHGTDVWKGNAQDLMREGICTLNTVIGCRDGIMTQLIYWGLPNKESFDIMERVRKGKGLSEEQEALMKENNVPSWYIDSCKKIKYMFPKAHAAAYSISSLRVAWFKVYYPEEYYCSYFTIRGDEFDGEYMCNGVEGVKTRRKFLHTDFARRTPTEKSEYYLCELVEEMYARSISFLPYDIEKSDAHRFQKIEKGQLLPPLDTIPNISTAMGQSIAEAREKDGPFKNREELARRASLGPVAMKSLADSGCLSHLPDSAQIDLFDFV